MICVVVNTVFLVVGEEPFVGGHGGHDGLSFSIVRVTEALNLLEKSDDILSTAN